MPGPLRVSPRRHVAADKPFAVGISRLTPAQRCQRGGSPPSWTRSPFLTVQQSRYFHPRRPARSPIGRELRRRAAVPAPIGHLAYHPLVCPSPLPPSQRPLQLSSCDGRIRRGLGTAAFVRRAARRHDGRSRPRAALGARVASRSRFIFSAPCSGLPRARSVTAALVRVRIRPLPRRDDQSVFVRGQGFFSCRRVCRDE